MEQWLTRRTMSTQATTGLPLSYLPGIALPLLLQAAFSYLLIMASSGNGSFVGLGVMLMALPGIPITALINFFILRGARQRPGVGHILRIALTTLALPALQLALLILVSVLHL